MALEHKGLNSALSIVAMLTASSRCTSDHVMSNAGAVAFSAT